MVLLGCSQQPQQRLTTPTPIQTTPEMENFTITIKLDGSLDDWKNSGVVPLIIEERKPNIPDSANPHLVYLATDGNFIYVAMEIFGKIEEERNYLVLIYNSETKEVLRIKWDYVERGFETEYLKGGKYIKNIETYGAKSSNVLEIASKSYYIAKDCDGIKVVVSKKGKVEAEYSKIIPNKVPKLKISFELEVTHIKTKESEGEIENFPSNFSKLVEFLDTPEKLSKFMESYFHYKYHSGCVAYSPEEFFELREGDCKDYAVFSSYILNKHGYNAEMLAFRFSKNGETDGHVITIFTAENGKLRYISFAKIYGDFSSIDEILEAEKQRIGFDKMISYRLIEAGDTNTCIK